MNEKYITFPEAVANGEIVRAMTVYLVDAFNEFIAGLPDDAVTYRDALMGVHNMHVHIILDLVDRSGGSTLWIDAAVGTFRERMEREKQARKGGKL